MEQNSITIIVFIITTIIIIASFLVALLSTKKKTITISLIKETTRKNETFYFIKVNEHYQSGTTTPSYTKALELFKTYCETKGEDKYETIKEYHYAEKN